MSDIINNLRKQAQEIADEGHDGWGNTMSEAADTIAALREELQKEKNFSNFINNNRFDLVIKERDDLRSRLAAAEGKVEKALKIASMRSKFPATMTNYCLEHIEEIEQILRGEP